MNSMYENFATTAKVRLTGKIIRVLRSSLGPEYVFGAESRKIYHIEELEFGRRNQHIFSYQDFEPSYDNYDGLPF